MTLRDIDRVEQLIRRYPGLPVAWYSWLICGGQISNGQPVGTTPGHDFATHHKQLKVQQRVTELVARQRVVMRVPSVSTKTPGLGCYPADGRTTPPAAANQPPPPQAASKERVASALAALKLITSDRGANQ